MTLPPLVLIWANLVWFSVFSLVKSTEVTNVDTIYNFNATDIDGNQVTRQNAD